MKIKLQNVLSSDGSTLVNVSSCEMFRYCRRGKIQSPLRSNDDLQRQISNGIPSRKRSIFSNDSHHEKNNHKGSEIQFLQSLMTIFLERPRKLFSWMDIIYLKIFSTLSFCERKIAIWNFTADPSLGDSRSKDFYQTPFKGGSHWTIIIIIRYSLPRDNFFLFLGVA